MTPAAILAAGMPAGADARSRAAVAPARWRAAVVVLAVCLLALLVRRYDAPVVLLAGAVVLPAALLLLRPELATLLVVFLLYVNLPGILSKRHGVPVALAGAFTLLLALPLLQALLLRRERLRLDGTLLRMLAFLGVLLLSAFVARDPRVALAVAGRYVAEGLVLYLLVVNVVRRRDTIRRVVWTMLAAGSLLGALTTYQEATGAFRREFGGLAERNHEFGALRRMEPDDPESMEALRSYVERNGLGGKTSQRANGPLDEPNRFAQILVVLLPLALLAWRTGRGAWARGAAVGAALLIACGIVVSDSRGAFVTLVLLAGLAGAVRWIPRVHLAVGALVGLLLLPVVAPRYVQRLATLAGATTVAGGGGATRADGAVKGRAAAMTAAARVFAGHPIVGVGAGQFQPFYSAEYQQNDPRFRFRAVRSYHAHSLYLQLGAELGVVGLVTFLSIFVAQLRALARAARRWREERPELAQLAIALAFSILAYLGTSVFLHVGFQRYLWLLVGLAGATLHLLDDAARGVRREATSP